MEPLHAPKRKSRYSVKTITACYIYKSGKKPLLLWQMLGQIIE